MARSTTSKVSNETKGGTKKSSTKSKQSPKEKGRPRRRDHSFEGCIVPHCGKSFTRTSDVKRHLSAHKWWELDKLEDIPAFYIDRIQELIKERKPTQQQSDESQNQTQLMRNPLQVSSTAANPENAQEKRRNSGSSKVQGTPMQGKDSVPFDSTINHSSVSWSSTSPSLTPAHAPQIAVTKKKGVGRPRTQNSSAKVSKSAAIAYYHAPSMASTSQTDSAAFVDPSEVDDKIISTSEQPLSLPHSHLSPSSSFNIASTSQPSDARELSPLSLFNPSPEPHVVPSSFDATTYSRNHPYSFAHDTSWSNSPSTVSSTQPLTGGFSTASGQVYGNSSTMSTPGQQTDVTAPSVSGQFQNFTSESALFQRQDCSRQPPQFYAPAWKGQMASASSLFSSNRTPSTYQPLAGTQAPSSFSLPNTVHEFPSFNTTTQLSGRFLSPSSDATTTHTSPLSSGLLDTTNAVNPDASSFNAIPSYSSTPHPLSLNTTTLYPVQSVFSSPSPPSSSSSMIHTPHSDSCVNTLPFNTTTPYSAQSTFNTPSSSSLFGTVQDYYTPPPFSSQTALPTHQAVWPAQETYPQDDSYRMNAMGPAAGASAHNYDTRAADYNYW